MEGGPEICMYTHVSGPAFLRRVSAAFEPAEQNYKRVVELLTTVRDVRFTDEVPTPSAVAAAICQ